MQESKKRKHSAACHYISKKLNRDEEILYLRNLEKKYNVSLPNRLPIVSVERLQFKSSHFTQLNANSSVNIVENSASFYDILGKIINLLEVYDKYSALLVCRLWNRAGNEKSAWKNITIKNRNLTNLNSLQQIILKNYTSTLYLDNVSTSNYIHDFCRFHTISSLECYKTDTKLIKLILKACNRLIHFKTDTEDDTILECIDPYVKSVNIENITLNYENSMVIKKFSELESLIVKTIDPDCYKSMTLFFSIKNLIIRFLYIHYDIPAFIECVPNIEFLQLKPIYDSFDNDECEANKLIVEALKRCPSLRKVCWHLDTTSKTNGNVPSYSDSWSKDECNHNSNNSHTISPSKVKSSLKTIALKTYLTCSLTECEVTIDC